MEEFQISDLLYLSELGNYDLMVAVLFVIIALIIQNTAVRA